MWIWLSSILIWVSFDRSNITPSQTLQASGTLRPDRRQSLAIGRLENNICHVAYACGNACKWCIWVARMCEAPLLGHESMWVHPWRGIHIRFARVNAHYDNTRYNSLITRVNMTRWNITRQLSVRNISCAYIRRYRGNKQMCLNDKCAYMGKYAYTKNYVVNE